MALNPPKKRQRQDLRENLEKEPSTNMGSNPSPTKQQTNEREASLVCPSNSLEPVYLSRICCSALSAQPRCIGQQCWYHRSSSSVTHHNEHFTQSLPSLLPCCLPLCLPLFASLAFLALPFCSQANKRLSVSFLKILFCNQLVDKPPTSPNCFPWLLFPSCPYNRPPRSGIVSGNT